MQTTVMARSSSRRVKAQARHRITFSPQVAVRARNEPERFKER
jgi:hypothetical protein